MARSQKTTELITAMRDAYASRQCVCRKPKETRKPFCRRCERAIPRPLRYGLQSPDTETMAYQFRECVGWLEDNMFVGTGTKQTLFGQVRTGIPVPKVLKRPAKKKPVNKLVKLAGGREKCLGTEWDKRREEAHARAGGRCERRVVKELDGEPRESRYIEARCNRLAPLHEVETEEGYIIKAGHAHHIKRRKERDDRLSNLEWQCAKCHLQVHGPEKVVPAKPALEASHGQSSEGSLRA